MTKFFYSSAVMTAAICLAVTTCSITAADAGSRRDGTNPRAMGTNPRALGTNPRALGTNPRALETNPRALGTNPRAGDKR